MNELIEKEDIKIENMIYEIRGKQVMLDSDLAKLYHVETKRINEAVKNNPEKFPERFSWVLTENDWFFLRSKFSTLENDISGRGHHRKYLPRVFTEQGVAMLATILKSRVATKVSINIMDAFVLMRKYISSSLIEQKYINDLVLEDHNRIELLENSFQKLEENKEVNEIYFDGKIYDAYSKILDIFKETNKELIIIDRYTDKTMLDMIKNLECRVILITSKNTKITKLDIEKYNSTYNNLTVIYDDTYHDRYFILDKDKIYHSGNSVNHIGYRKSSINKLEDSKIKQAITEDIEKILSLQEM